MTELLLCPFCGGKQTYRKHDGAVWLTTTNHKRGCIMREALSFVAFDTEAEAIEAWNTRAERTCEQEERGWSTEGDHARVWLTCGHDCMVPTVQDLPNYCPNCGARVVDGKEGA